MTVTTEIAPDRADLRRSLDRGVAWLEQQLAPDGSFADSEADLVSYYKSLIVFPVCGRHESAERCREFLRGHFLNPDGDLSSGDRKTGLEPRARNLANYMDSWVALGAWLFEDFALAEKVAEHLVESQSPRHGGILTGPRRWSGEPRYDLATTASCGHAFLFCGRHDAARAAGEFLLEALDRQPAPDRGPADRPEGLVLAFDADWRPVEAPTDEERMYYHFDPSRSGERIWIPAIVAAFLCELYEVTGERRHLDAAERYFRFIEYTPEYREGRLANGKAGWSAGLLARTTGREEYRAVLRLIARRVLERQAENGEFQPHDTPSGDGGGPQGADMPHRLERTADLTIWTAEYLRMSAAGLMDGPTG